MKQFEDLESMGLSGSFGLFSGIFGHFLIMLHMLHCECRGLQLIEVLKLVTTSGLAILDRYIKSDWQVTTSVANQIIAFITYAARSA